MRSRFCFFLLISAALVGCDSSPKKIVYEKDSVKLAQDFLPGVASSPSPEAHSLKEKIQGIWTDGEGENAVFHVKPDSIYYVDQFTSYKYSLEKDSIHIFYEDGPEAFKIHFVKDTLMMDSQDFGSSKFWKFKN